MSEVSRLYVAFLIPLGGLPALTREGGSIDPERPRFAPNDGVLMEDPVLVGISERPRFLPPEGVLIEDPGFGNFDFLDEA